MHTPRRIKRALDIVLSACALTAFAPVMLVIAVLIRLTMGTPVLFRHVRPGMYGAPFALVKFRTMREPSSAGADEPAETRKRADKISARKWGMCTTAI